MGLNKIALLGKEYINIDVIDNIAIPDCFVARQNKIGRGNGEAKLYVGSRANIEQQAFLVKQQKCKVFY